MKTKVDVIFGGQFGSEGKGVITSNLAYDYDVHVRVGAPNAGHSFIGPDSKKWVMQIIPCGWVNPNATLIIGRGGLIDPVLLRKEVEAIAVIDPSIYNRLVIDPLCGVLDRKFYEAEGGIHGEIHKRIGSTGEGVGSAREARISRDPGRFYLYEELAKKDYWFAQFIVRNTPTVIDNLREAGKKVLLEGAQGQGLSLIHGPWPYVTSTDPGPAQLAADVGIPSNDFGRIIAVMRAFPIRVAGNSGPLVNEITWDQLSRELGMTTVEHTTVTKKKRRIGRWDDGIATQCRILHHPTEIALTFIDYINPDDTGVDKYSNLSNATQHFIERVERVMKCSVTIIGTGGPRLHVIMGGSCSHVIHH